MRPKIWDGAAALSFYTVMAIFPALLVLLALSAFVPTSLTSEIPHWWQYYLPENVKEILFGVIEDISQGKSSTSILSFGFIVAVWTGTSGVAAIMRQLNNIYNLEDTRSIVKIRLIALGIAVALTTSLLISFLLIVLGQLLMKILMGHYYLEFAYVASLNIFRFLVGAFVFFLGFTALYYWGPQKHTRVAYLWPGSLFATLVVTASSFMYSKYLALAGGYSATYGSLSAAVGLLVWLYIISFIILIGAEINRFWEKRQLRKS